MNRRWYLLSAAALALLIAAGLWLRDTGWPEPPLNVIFLTVESWRAEAARPERMPNLFRAAAEGTRYANHRAISAWTAPNMIAVLTGLSPFEQGVHARGQSIDAAREVFLEDLAARGWRVAALQSFMAIDVFRNLGLTVTPQEEPLSWLAARAREGELFVLWYHYLRTHLPYAPSADFRGPYEAIATGLDASAMKRMKTVQSASKIPAGSVAFEPGDLPAVRTLYLGGVAEFDAWFGAFWDFFNRSGLRKTTVLVVTADHGDELLERGNVGHASTTRAGHLHDEILRVPLFVWLPGKREGTVVRSATDHTDIVPFLRSVLGLSGPRMLSASHRYVAATSFSGYTETDPNHPSGFEAAMIEDGWKLRLRQARGGPVVPHLYDLTSDPGETDDLAGAQPDRVGAMTRVLLPKLLSLWRPPQTDQIAASSAGNIARPEWVTPQSSRTIHYADIADGARLQWTGNPSGRYVVEYRAGEGALAIDGALDVEGTTKDFGTVGEFYWRTWVVPYHRVWLRVAPAERKSLASQWIALKLAP
jgi:choline-sulfatase